MCFCSCPGWAALRVLLCSVDYRLLPDSFWCCCCCFPNGSVLVFCFGFGGSRLYGFFLAQLLHTSCTNMLKGKDMLSLRAVTLTLATMQDGHVLYLNSTSMQYTYETKSSDILRIYFHISTKVVAKTVVQK